MNRPGREPTTYLMVGRHANHLAIPDAMRNKLRSSEQFYKQIEFTT